METGLALGSILLDELFTGNMGSKNVYLGNELIYTRTGGYFFLELKTTTKETD